MESMTDADLRKFGINPALFTGCPPQVTEPAIEPVTTPSANESEVFENLVESPIKIKLERRRTSTKRSSTSTRASVAKKRAHIYNLRERTTYSNSKTKRLIRELKYGLLPVNPDNYHTVKSDEERQLILVTKNTRPEQVETFIDHTGEYLILSWLGTARIFRYVASEKSYGEIKRIPDRYIEISPKIITCLHYCDKRLYLAYLWAIDDKRPFIEIRDIDGTIVGETLYYKEGDSIDSIKSDQDYIYIRTTSGLLDIHRRDCFGIISKRIDFYHDIGKSVHSTWVDQQISESTTRFALVSATQKRILVTAYDILDHAVMHCYDFGDGYNIVSIVKIDKLYIIHRKLCGRSIIDFGFLARTQKDSKDLEFINEASITFEETSHIIQLKATRRYLYIFGSKKLLCGLKNYEIGCLYIPSLTPLWIHGLNEANDNSLIIPHSSGIGFMNGSQKISHIPIALETHHCDQCGFGFPSEEGLHKHNNDLDHQSIMTGMIIAANQFMQDNGISIFKKLHTR